MIFFIRIITDIIVFLFFNVFVKNFSRLVAEAITVLRRQVPMQLFHHGHHHCRHRRLQPSAAIRRRNKYSDAVVWSLLTSTRMFPNVCKTFFFFLLLLFFFLKATCLWIYTAAISGHELRRRRQRDRCTFQQLKQGGLSH